MNSKPFLTGISLTEYESSIVKKVSEDRGLYNFSAAIRQIIREWDSFQNGHNKQSTPIIEREEQPAH